MDFPNILEQSILYFKVVAGQFFINLYILDPED